MKNLIVCSFFLLISAFANGQISVMPYFRIDKSNLVQKSEGLYCNGWSCSGIESKSAYSTGIDIDYRFLPNWSVKTGLMYQEMGNLVPERELSILFWDNGNLNFFYADVKSEVTWRFLNIPIQLQYNFRNDKRFSPYIALGGMINKTLGQGEYAKHTYSENGIEKEVGVPIIEVGDSTRQINFSPKTDIGFQYNVSPQINIQAFASANVLLLPTTTYFENRFYNIGIGLGVAYSI